MRKILLFVFALSFTTLNAQNFSVETLEKTIYGSPSIYTFYEDIDLYNDLGSPFIMHWERIEESIPEGWETSNCDPNDCRAIGVTGASFTLPNSVGFLNTHFYPHGIAGSGYMKVKLWPDTNPADSVILTYYGVAGTVGVEEIEAQDIQVYPSPAKNILNVMLPNPNEAITVNVTNVNGQVVDEFDLSQGN